MSNQTAGKKSVYADLCALPANMIGEIVNGELVARPRPKARHIRAASALGSEIFGPYDKGKGGPGGWWILDEPEIHLADHVLVPDIAGWKKARMPALPDTHVFDLPPDWVCEVLSPGNVGRDCVEKAPIYAEHGVGHMWLLDPENRRLEVFGLTDGKWTLLSEHKETEQVRAEPFTELELELGLLWS